MASAGPGGSLPPNFLLTPQQQSLLFAALNSNKPQSANNANSGGTGLTLSPSSFESLPVQSGSNDGLNESPYLDNYNYDDVGDSSFDFSLIDDQPRMIGDMSETAETAKSNSADSAEGHEKRSHPDDDDDDDDSTKPKRRESSDGKTPKKPGRKPLTSEPSSKRKAQNRAAQRAFRERKEQHLKDLETQVEDLTKASEAANHENSKLRAQVERMTTELKQYKQRLSVVANQKPAPREKSNFGSAAVSNLSDVNFQFNFPKFGSLPGPQDKPQRSISQPISPPNQTQTQSPARSQTSDISKVSASFRASNGQFNDELAKFAGVFTPSMNSSATNDSRASLDSANYSNGGSMSSPSTSSNSNAGPSSSCGTSPEPYTQSPIGSKPIDTMSTIGEEQTNTQAEPFAQFANIDFGSTSNFDWLAQQNGGAFDPQLLGDYREPQDNVLSNPSFDDFFNDAFDTDFITPYNVAPSPNFAKNTTTAQKPNLIEAIDAQQNDYNDGLPPKPDSMNCNQIWYDSSPLQIMFDPSKILTDDYRERLQSCPKAQNGEFDLDGLCSELTKKAKCSGSGPVVGENDFDSILQKFMGKDCPSDKVASTLGIEIDRQSKPNGVSNGLGMP
jgi:AP-1-like factor